MVVKTLKPRANFKKSPLKGILSKRSQPCCFAGSSLENDRRYTVLDRRTGRILRLGDSS